MVFYHLCPDAPLYAAAAVTTLVTMILTVIPRTGTTRIHVVQPPSVLLSGSLNPQRQPDVRMVQPQPPPVLLSGSSGSPKSTAPTLNKNLS